MGETSDGFTIGGFKVDRINEFEEGMSELNLIYGKKNSPNSNQKRSSAKVCKSAPTNFDYLSESL